MIDLFVATEIRLYRDGIAEVLGRADGLSVVGTAGDTPATLERVAELRPAVTLVDMTMPGALDAVRRIAAATPVTRVLVLAVPEAEDSVLACAEAGAVGFVSRSASLPDLVTAVHQAVRGELSCSARAAAVLMRRVADLSATRRSPRRLDLTARQREILELIDEGLANKEIARRLTIEVSTVKNHVHNILEKLEVPGRAQAAALLRSTLSGDPRRI